MANKTVDMNVVKKVTMTADEYREFVSKATVLEDGNYEMLFQAEKLHDDTYNVTVYGQHDWDKLDLLTS